MILEYEKKQSIYAEDIEYEEDEKVLTANTIKTDYVPTNFEGTTKNFCLRDGHVNWDRLQTEAEQRIHKEWLEELGYDPKLWQVNYTTHKIQRTNPLLSFDSSMEDTSPETI